MNEKYPRTPHLPFSPGTTSDDRIAPSFQSLLNKPIVITEKLDGGNIDFNNIGVFARSHAIQTENPWDKKMLDIYERIKRHLSDGLDLFGENMHAVHSIEYTALTDIFYLFAVRDNNKWLSWKEVEETAFLLDLSSAPVLFTGIIKSETEFIDIVNDLVKQPSCFGGKREGVVIRIADEFSNDDFATSVMKWVRKGHVQTTEHWTKQWRMGKGKVHTIINKYE